MPEAQGLRAMTAMTTQPTLPGFGPAADDGFRFTWWNTAEGARVWSEHRGRWRHGIIVERGRTRATVRIAAASGKSFSVAKPYSELRRRR